MSSEGCWEAGLPAQDWIPLVSLGISMLCLVVLPELLNSPECSEILQPKDSSEYFMVKYLLEKCQ